jgi:hypothetical protein
MVRQRSAAMEQEKLAQRANTDQRLSGHGAPSVSNAANVAGRKTVGPQEGFGPLWRKVYRVRLHGAAVTPQQVIAEWKAHFNRFWPANANFYKPLTGIQPGEVAFVDLQPGGAPLSTGMLVLDVDETSFTLMTPQGHMFAGWITFSAAEVDSETVAQAQVLMRASDPIFEMGLMMGGHRQEDRFWQQTLTALAANFDHEGDVDTKVVCVDKKRQWSRWKNIWHSSAIRSTLYTLGAPFRAVKRLFSRNRAVA